MGYLNLANSISFRDSLFWSTLDKWDTAWRIEKWRAELGLQARVLFLTSQFERLSMLHTSCSKDIIWWKASVRLWCKAISIQCTVDHKSSRAFYLNQLAMFEKWKLLTFMKCRFNFAFTFDSFMGLPYQPFLCFWNMSEWHCKHLTSFI